MARKRSHTPRKSPAATNQPATSAPNCETDEVASLKVLQDLARKMQKSLLDEQNTRATFADYLKLLQLIKEAEGNTPRQITVRWVDPPWLTTPGEDTPESQES